ncbi:MAG: cyclic nucleotide-binding domain-containing protein [Candidatus Edwardsbacteria bacterium]
MGLESILREFLLFQEMTEEELIKIAPLLTSAKSILFLPGASICKKGDAGDSLYLIKSGKVRVSVAGNGKEIILAELGAGKFFGEMSLLDLAPRSANVTALENTEIFIITRATVAYLIEKEPRIAAKLMLALCKVLCARIRVLDDRLQAVLSVSKEQ